MLSDSVNQAAIIDKKAKNSMDILIKIFILYKFQLLHKAQLTHSNLFYFNTDHG